MQKTSLLLIIFLTSQLLFAQRFDWATSGGYVGIANSFLGAIDIARDPVGNIYTIDYGSGQQQCQGDTINPFSSYTTFIYKFNPNGQLQFINRVGATGGGVFVPFNIETDESGNLYLLGQPNGVSSIIVNNDTVSVTGNTNQLIKLDSVGNYLWHNNTGYASNGDGCMLQYSNGYIYYQSGNLSISKIDANGVKINTLTASYYKTPTAATQITFKGSSKFSDGNLLFAAYSYGTIAYGTDTLFHTGNPFLSAPILLLRCDENLNLVWARYQSNARNPDNNFIPVAIDSNDAVYTAVQVNQKMIIGNDTIDNPNGNFTGEGAIVKVDAAGNDIWANALTSSSTSFAWCMTRAEDDTGIIIGGGYTGTAQFSPYTLYGNSSTKPFIAKFDYNGNYLNAFNYLQNQSTEALSLLSDGKKNYYVGGKLSTTTSPVFSCTPIAPVRGFYLGSFTENPDTVPTPSITVNGSLLTASPHFEGNIQWFLNGNIINGATGLTYTATQNGNYSVEYSYPSGCTNTVSSSIITFALTSVNSNSENNIITLFPNPTQGIFQFHGTEQIKTSVSVTIKNLIGAIIYKVDDYRPNQLFDIQNAPSGLYFVEISYENSLVSFKVLKQ